MKAPRTPSVAQFKSLALAASIGWWLLLCPVSILGPACCFAADSATPDAIADAQAGHGALTRQQLLDHLGVSAWHRAGFKGKGFKIAILDTGFSGYRQHLGKALPEHVTVHSFRTDGILEAKDSQHGILCGEVIHTLAPEAELLLANWDVERPESFLEALRWAKEQGARVVSCSVILPTWSDGEGHGPLHDAMKRILGEDVLLFASAGNTAQRHWSGVFHDGGDGCHEWSRHNHWNAIKPWGGERVSVELCGQPGADYELTVEDETTDRQIGQSATLHKVNRDCAVVQFSPEAGHIYRMKVRLVRGTANSFHVVVLGGGLETATPNGSIAFPGDGSEVIAVGAVAADGQRCAYSSCGPNSSQPKPDLVATVPFPSEWRSRPFSGTSAAAPQAAALAVLMWAKYPKESGSKIKEKLREAAERLGKAKHDFETGFGRIHLP